MEMDYGFVAQPNRMSVRIQVEQFESVVQSIEPWNDFGGMFRMHIGPLPQKGVDGRFEQHVGYSSQSSPTLVGMKDDVMLNWTFSSRKFHDWLEDIE